MTQVETKIYCGYGLSNTNNSLLPPQKGLSKILISPSTAEDFLFLPPLEKVNNLLPSQGFWDHCVNPFEKRTAGHPHFITILDLMLPGMFFFSCPELSGARESRDSSQQGRFKSLSLCGRGLAATARAGSAFKEQSASCHPWVTHDRKTGKRKEQLPGKTADPPPAQTRT